MFGLVVLLILAGYVAVAVWVTAKAPGLWKFALAVAWIALPTWDAALGRAVLSSKCAHSTSLTIAATPQTTDALYVPSAVFSSSPAYYGYRVVEGKARKDWYKPTSDDRFVQRATRTNGGEVVLEDMVPRSANYGLFKENLSPVLLVRPTKHFVKDMGVGKELGHFKTYYFPGGWAERALAAGGVHGESCYSADALHQRQLELLARTIPANGRSG